MHVMIENGTVELECRIVFNTIHRISSNFIPCKVLMETTLTINIPAPSARARGAGVGGGGGGGEKEEKIKVCFKLYC